MCLLRPSACDSLPFNWNSNFIYSVGGTHCFDNGWNVSAGYNFIANSTSGTLADVTFKSRFHGFMFNCDVAP